jgi:hypothetical protein
LERRQAGPPQHFARLRVYDVVPHDAAILQHGEHEVVGMAPLVAHREDYLRDHDLV